MAEAMMESFGCSSFLAVLGEASKNRSRLQVLLEGYADLVSEFEEFKADQGDLEDSLLPVVKAIDRIGASVRGLLAMACVIPNHKGSTAAHANAVRGYTGSSLLEATLRDIVASNSWWQRMYDDLVTKGAGSIAHSSELRDLTNALTEAEQMDAALFRKCVAKLPVFKKQMRQGACADLEKVLYKQAVVVARELEANKTAEIGLSLCDSVIEALGVFKETPGVLQMIAKVEATKQANMSAMCAVEIKDLFKAYPDNKEADIPGHFFQDALKRLVAAMRQMEVTHESLLPGLKNALWWHFRILHSVFQAACYL